MQINWSEEKNRILKQTRNVSFEDVEYAILNDQILDIVPHHNQKRFSHQELMIVSIRNYTYYVPFVMNKEEIFLKNIIPSRKYHKKYGKEWEVYTKEELEIVDYIENQNPKSIPDLDEKVEKIKSAIKAKQAKRKAINIEILESDLEKLKAKALEEGLPYRTFLNSLLHKYATGQLVEKDKIA